MLTSILAVFLGQTQFISSDLSYFRDELGQAPSQALDSQDTSDKLIPKHSQSMSWVLFLARPFGLRDASEIISKSTPVGVSERALTESVAFCLTWGPKAAFGPG